MVKSEIGASAAASLAAWRETFDGGALGSAGTAPLREVAGCTSGWAAGWAGRDAGTGDGTVGSTAGTAGTAGTARAAGAPDDAGTAGAVRGAAGGAAAETPAAASVSACASATAAASAQELRRVGAVRLELGVAAAGMVPVRASAEAPAGRRRSRRRRVWGCPAFCAVARAFLSAGSGIFVPPGLSAKQATALYGFGQTAILGAIGQKSPMSGTRRERAGWDAGGTRAVRRADRRPERRPELGRNSSCPGRARAYH